MFEDAEEDLLEFSPYPPNTTINDRLNKKCSCEVGTQVDLQTFNLLECFKMHLGVSTGFLWYSSTSSDYSFWRPACW